MKRNPKMFALLLICLLIVSLVAIGFAAKKPIIGSGSFTYDPNIPVNGGKPITIKFWWPSDCDTYYVNAVKEYKKIHPNVNIETNNAMGWGDYWNKLPVTLKTGQGPDVFHMHQSQVVRLMRIMAPWPKAMVDGALKEFNGVETFMIDGKVYTIPTGAMTATIYYNKKMWAAAGLTEADFPKTWDQLIAVAKKLVKKDASGKILVNGFDFNGDGVFMFIGLKYQKGSFQFKKDGITPNFNTKLSIEAAKFLQDLALNEGIMDPKGNASHEAFAQERSAMIYKWTWMTNYLKANAPNVDYGCFPIPTFDGKTPPAYERMGPETSLSVSNKASSNVQQAAFDFVKWFLANDQNLVALDLAQGCAPTKKSLMNNSQLLGSKSIAASLKIIDRTVCPGIMPVVYETNMGGMVGDRLFLKFDDPAAVLKEFDDEVSKAIGDVVVPVSERAYKYAKNFQE